MESNDKTGAAHQSGFRFVHHLNLLDDPTPDAILTHRVTRTMLELAGHTDLKPDEVELLGLRMRVKQGMAFYKAASTNAADSPWSAGLNSVAQAALEAAVLLAAKQKEKPPASG